MPAPIDTSKRFIIVGGKGGVGRTTVAAALGTVLARRGRRTLLAFARCERRLGKLLGCQPIGEEIRQVEPNLWAVNMNARAAIREIGMMVLRFRTIYRAVLENRWVRYFLRAVPALEDYSMLGKAWFHTTEQLEDGSPKYETVIFDGPATGNLISMLRIPQVILDSVPVGPLTADAQRIRSLLSDRQSTGMWLVTLAEEMPVSEADDLHRVVRDELDISADALVVNMLYPDPFQGLPPSVIDCLDRAVDGLDSGEGLAELVRAARTLHRRRRINDDYLGRLDQQIALPRVVLPHLFVSRFNRRSLDLLGARVDAALPGDGEG